jgi:hypothetical protein
MSATIRFCFSIHRTQYRIAFSQLNGNTRDWKESVFFTKARNSASWELGEK